MQPICHPSMASVNEEPTARPKLTAARAGRRLHMLSCTFCRRAKKKCDPQSRKWPQKCARCLAKGLSCSEPTRKVRTRRESPNPGSTGRWMREAGSIYDDQLKLPERLASTALVDAKLSSDAGMWTWNFADLSNMLAILQLAAAEMFEQESAGPGANRMLASLWEPQYCPISIEHPELEFLNRRHELQLFLPQLQRQLQAEIARRLQQTLQKSPERLLLDAAMGSVLDPLAGVLVASSILKTPTSLTNGYLSFPRSADDLHEQALRLIGDGQPCMAILYHSKSLVFGRKVPDRGFCKAIRRQKMPTFMASTCRKFGLPQQYCMPAFWSWPSMVNPTLAPHPSQQAAAETILLKTWIGFDDTLDLMESGRLRATSLTDWRGVFREAYLKPAKATKADDYGRTNIHVAAILQMDPADILNTVSNLVQKDRRGRLPVWYAAAPEGGRLFQELLEVTKLHAAKHNLPDVYSHRDANGADLIQFGMGRGLDYVEMLGLGLPFVPALDDAVGTMPGGELNQSQGGLFVEERDGREFMVMACLDF